MANTETETTSRSRTRPAHSDKPFQLALLVGPAAAQGEALADASAVITGEPGAVLPDAAVRGFATAKLSPSDLRSKTIVITDGDVDAAAAAYAVAVGFAARYLDVATPTGVILASTQRDARHLPDAGKASTRADLVVLVGPDAQLPHDLPARVLGEAAPEADVVVLQLRDGRLDHLTDAEVSTVRSARRVAVCASTTHELAFTELLVVAGVRSRKEFERLPLWVRGELVIDLDELRRAGATLRKEHRGYDTSLAPALTATARQQRLAEAATIGVRSVLTALGSESVNELWQCPRPWSHTHGDATPSMQVNEANQVRCYVDDAEWIDPLRLVMEVCGATPDEAASLLLSPPSALEPIRARIVAERTRRAGPAKPSAPGEDAAPASPSAPSAEHASSEQPEAPSA